MRKFKQLTLNDRLKIEVLVKTGHPVKEIAVVIGCHISTIYRELKRGTFVALNVDLTTEQRYSPDIANEKYRENLKAKGAGLKIGNDIKLAEYIENRIIDKKYSPEAVLGELQGMKQKFKVTICTTTLYSYIDKGLFLKLTNKSLPVKAERKRTYKKVKKQARASKGTSIEKRPKEIEERNEFGHWEMDTVVGRQGISKKSLLVLTERKTRKEVIIELKRHTAASVVRALNGLERRWGKMFYRVFKSIIVDNGSEFSDYEGMQKAVHRKGERTAVYYCHPYSSYERGSNENQNRLIRRHIPKGMDMDKVDGKQIKYIEKWMNHYPRRLFGFKTAEELFQEELNAL